jgi:ferrous iron transport protein A
MNLPHSSATSSSSTLEKLRPGQRARVQGLVGEGAVFQRLCEMGFVAGTELRVVRHAPFGDPLEVAVADFHLSLRKNEAAMVRVEPLS